MSERKAIFITGGGSGIGRAIAIHFGDKGWFVGLGDVDEAGMDGTASALTRGFTYSRKMDVRQPDQWTTALDAFSSAAGGRIDVVVNNAGVGAGGPLAELTTEEIDRTLDINLRGVFYGARAAYPHLKKTAPGSCLLSTCSAAGIFASANMSTYCASKFGVRAMSESLDAEWAPDGIKARTIMPSFIDTPLLQASSHAADNTPIRDRVVQAGLEFTPVEDVAQAAWDAIHGDKVHTTVGKTAKKLAFASRWTPWVLRKRARSLAEAGEWS